MTLSENISFCPNLPPSSSYESLRKKILAAGYVHDFSSIGECLEKILELLDNVPEDEFSENDEKTIRQIICMFNQFARTIWKGNQEIPEDLNARLQKKLRTICQMQMGRKKYYDYLQWKENLNLSSWQMDALLENLIALQLTKGCSNACRRCNEWALPQVRSHFSFSAVKTLLENIRDKGNTDFSLYGASDPLDWEEGALDFHNITNLIQENPPGILTKVPVKKQQVCETLAEKQIDFSISITRQNRQRVSRMEESLGRKLEHHHDTEELMIPAGMDEDFVSVKPSITDAYGTEITPEGAFLIIPTFTSALYPMGHDKISITGDTNFFPVRAQGRQALLIDYFKPIQVAGKDGKVFFLEKLLPVQVSSIFLDTGSLEMTPPGMRGLKEYFSIFEDGPRQKRKTITQSVLQRLEKEILHNENIPRKEREGLYEAKVRAHYDLCDRGTTLEKRNHAFCFFLSQCRDYLATHSIEKKIISFLIRKDITYSLQKYAHIFPERLNIAEFIDKTEGENIFPFFRFILALMVRGIHCPDISRIIEKYPYKNILGKSLA